jgi:hypothetical protein
LILFVTEELDSHREVLRPLKEELKREREMMLYDNPELLRM